MNITSPQGEHCLLLISASGNFIPFRVPSPTYFMNLDLQVSAEDFRHDHDLLKCQVTVIEYLSTGSSTVLFGDGLIIMS